MRFTVIVIIILRGSYILNYIFKLLYALSYMFVYISVTFYNIDRGFKSLSNFVSLRSDEVISSIEMQISLTKSKFIFLMKV